MQKCQKFSDVAAIHSDDGKILTLSQKINNEFTKFYSKLYSSEVNFDKNSCNLFLKGLKLPALSETEANHLGYPITLDELKRAAMEMKRGKSPGWDGIPPEVYVTFWEQLGPFMLAMIQDAIEAGDFFNYTNTALIIVLPKSDKDSTKCSNYRPLSILNAEIKIFAKVLASPLEPYMSKLIHRDQTGFMKSRLASDNIRRLLQYDILC